MTDKRLSKISEKKVWTLGAMLPFALPVLLLFAFLSQQISGFDNIGWSHGFSHPLEGWDHLVTMLAVGVWAAQMRGKSIWILPLAFVSIMSLGGLAGAAGLSIPSVEGIILLSCAVFGVLITRKICFSTQVNVLIVGFFAFFHGFAHGQEISTSASLVSYTLGFMLATLLLHGAGILVAKLIVLSIVSLTAFFTASSSQAQSFSAIQTIDNTKTVVSSQNYSFLLGVDYLFCPPNIEQSPQIFDTQRIHVFGSSVVKFASLPIIKPCTTHSFQVDSLLHNTLQGIVFNQPLLAIPSQLLRNQFDVGQTIVEFNRYYPNINNSPGTSLLSNGVGLTSPPLIFPAFRLSSASPNRFTPHTDSIEVPLLQSLFAKFQQNTPFVVALKGHWHFFAIAFPQDKISASHLASYFVPNNSAQYINAVSALISTLPPNYSPFILSG